MLSRKGGKSIFPPKNLRKISGPRKALFRAGGGGAKSPNFRISESRRFGDFGGETSETAPNFRESGLRSPTPPPIFFGTGESPPILRPPPPPRSVGRAEDRDSRAPEPSHGRESRLPACFPPESSGKELFRTAGKAGSQPYESSGAWEARARGRAFAPPRES